MALVESRYFPDESPWGLFRQARCSHVEALGGPGAGFHTGPGGTGSRVSYRPWGDREQGFIEGRGTGGTGCRVLQRGVALGVPGAGFPIQRGVALGVPGAGFSI